LNALKRETKENDNAGLPLLESYYIMAKAERAVASWFKILLIYIYF